MSTSSLVLPLATWNGVPKHTVTCVHAFITTAINAAWDDEYNGVERDVTHEVVDSPNTASPGGSPMVERRPMIDPNLLGGDDAREVHVVATGSKSGHVCLWRVLVPQSGDLREARLFADMVCFGASSPVSALCDILLDNTQHAVASVSIDGTVSLWDVRDGSSIATAEQLVPDAHLAVRPLADQQSLACAGRGSDIVIVDVHTLRIKQRIEGHADWVVSVGVYDFGSARDPWSVLVSLSHDGAVRCWSLRSGERHVESPVQRIIVDDTFYSDPAEFRTALLSPDKRLVVVVLEHAWMVYSASDATLIHTAELPPFIGRGFANACFCDQSSRRLLLWGSEGEALLVRLPAWTDLEPLRIESKVPGSPMSASVPADPASRQSDSVALDESAGSDAHKSNHRNCVTYEMRYRVPRSLVRRRSTLERPQFHFSQHERLVVASGGDGCTVAFGLVRECDSQLFTSVDDTPVCEVNVYARLSDGWRMLHGAHAYAHRRRVRSVKGSEYDLNEKDVCCSLLIEDSFLLVRGFRNGAITLNSLPTDPYPLTIRNAHRGSVTALFNPRFETHPYVVSAGADFLIKVHDIAIGQTIHTFAHHSGPITHLFSAPLRKDWTRKEHESRWRGSFFSVGRDRTVGHFSLESMSCRHVFTGHPAPIESVRWRLEQNYLIVACKDGSVCVWDLTSGQMETCVYGDAADLILSTCADQMRLRPKRAHELTLPVTGDIVPNGESSHISAQIILLNIKLLVHDLRVRNTDMTAPRRIIAERIHSGGHRRSKSSTTEDLPSSSSPSSSSSLTPNLVVSAASPKLSRSSEALTLAVDDSLHGSSSAFAHNRSTAQQVYTYILSWGVNHDLDRTCIHELFIRPPDPPVCFAVQGDGGYYSVCVPATSGGGRRFLRSPRSTSLHLLSIVSMTNAMQWLEEEKSPAARLLSYFSRDLWQSLRSSARRRSTMLNDNKSPLVPVGSSNDLHVEEASSHYPLVFVPPSLGFLAQFWQEPLDDVKRSARSLFIQAVDLMSETELKTFAETWGVRLLAGAQSDPSSPMGRLYRVAVVVLGILGIERPKLLDATLARAVTSELLRMVFTDAGSQQIVACELLGSGFASIWSPYVKDPKALMQRLFTLSLRSNPLTMSQTAHHALTTCGAGSPAAFVLGVAEQIFSKSVDSRERSAALLAMGSLIKKNPRALLSQLPRVVDTVVRSLDPNVPHMRDGSIKASTTVIHSLVRRYPMIAFHQDTQRLALGTRNALIVIYDLKTAARWHVLEGHKEALTCLAFSPNGSRLCSYSLKEAQVRFWQVTTSFFGLGRSPHLVSSYAVSPVDENLSISTLLESAKLTWSNPNEVELMREWEGTIVFQTNP